MNENITKISKNNVHNHSHSISLPNVSRTLQKDAPRKKYKKRQKEEPLANHWGQRKLFLVEIEFLTNYTNKKHKTIVVYPGAAPGTHIKYLSELFPHCYFILVDPCPFKVKPCADNIEIRNEYFTHQMAQELYDEYRVKCPDTHLLFMSDIRTANWREMEFDENEEYVQKDNKMQLEWSQILQPDKAMLKFRLPYIKGQTEYFDGDLYLSPWGPNRTTETRLVPKATRESWKNKEIMTIWDHTKYEEQLYYFNTKTRLQTYVHNVRGEGINYKYDSCAEILIVYEYLKKFVQTASDPDQSPTPEDVARMSYEISRRISRTTRTLLTILPEPEKRKQFKSVNHKKFYEEVI